MIAKTPEPPYYAVIFTSVRTEGDKGYSNMSKKMLELAQEEDGFLGAEWAREHLGITVSYWKNTASIKKWKENMEHLNAQELGKREWYKAYCVRVAKVEKDYGFSL